MLKNYTNTQNTKQQTSFSCAGNSAAFTLAEVLITLGVIGIVAAMTLPSLINKIEEKHYISMYKKAYTELLQVQQRLNFAEGDDFTYKCATFDNKCFRELFAKEMKIVRECYSAAPNECQATSKFLDGSIGRRSININASWPMFVTASGYSVKFRFHYNGCDDFVNGVAVKNCGWVQIDTNGVKKPNTVGKDIFFLTLFKNKFVPSIVSTETTEKEAEKDCYSGSGDGCAAIFLTK